MSNAGMNDAQKARLIGAIALVFVAFIALSWLLGSGDNNRKATAADTRDKVIVLPARPVRTTAVGSEARDPVPDGKADAAPAPAPEPSRPAAPAPEPAKPKPTPAEPPPSRPAATQAPRTPPPARPATGWYVQLGSFGSTANARALAQKAREGDYRTELRPQQVNGRTLHRVLVGPYPSEAAAALRVPKLKNWLGETGRVVELERD